MPTYQYACTECGHAFEQFQSFSEDALTVCPECDGKLRKLFNAVGVVFKGSGFYRTDSRCSLVVLDAGVDDVVAPARATPRPLGQHVRLLARPSSTSSSSLRLDRPRSSSSSD